MASVKGHAHDARRQGLQHAHQVTHEARQHGLVDGFLVLEVLVQRAHADTGDVGDVRGRACQAMSAQADVASVQDGLDGGFGALLLRNAGHGQVAAEIRIESE